MHLVCRHRPKKYQPKTLAKVLSYLSLFDPGLPQDSAELEIAINNVLDCTEDLDDIEDTVDRQLQS
jgi:hypothetical protein